MRKIFISCVIMALFASPLVAEEMPGLKVGVKAPDFEALNFKGEKVKLSDLYKNGPAVLIFYRGGWCYYCNIQLRELQANLDNFKKHNATLVALSVDTVVNAAATVKDKGLGFEVISNPEADILEAYELIYKVPDELNEQYKEKYNIDLEAASGRTDHVIAIPATYIIDTKGTIVFAYANEDYKVRASVEEILQELEKLPSN